MRMTIESTSKTVVIDGVEARVWEGHTESGIPVVALIPRVAVADNGADLSQFDRELREQRAPSAEVQAWPARLVL